MNHQQLSLDEQIDAAHLQSEQAETSARALDQRIGRIANLEAYSRGPRRHGVMRNPWAAGGLNLTAQGLIARNDPGLAAWLAAQAGVQAAGPDYDAEDAAAAATEQLHRMAAASVALEQQNATRQQQLEQQRTYGHRTAGSR